MTLQPHFALSGELLPLSKGSHSSIEIWPHSLFMQAPRHLTAGRKLLWLLNPYYSYFYYITYLVRITIKKINLVIKASLNILCHFAKQCIPFIFRKQNPFQRKNTISTEQLSRIGIRVLNSGILCFALISNLLFMFPSSLVRVET